MHDLDRDRQDERKPHEWFLWALLRGIVIALALTIAWTSLIHAVGWVLG